MKTILLSSPVNQTEEIFKEYLWSINRIYIPEGFILKKYFYLHNCQNLSKFLNDDEYEYITDDSTYDVNETTHLWKNNNFSSVCNMRNLALSKARNENYDYLFSLDSDVLVNPNVLKLLIDDNKDMVGNIYWTDFGNSNNLLPNCYDYEGVKFYSAMGGIDRLKIMGIYEVGVVGACVLIGKRIINEEKINYDPIVNLNCTKWEDQAFATRCRCLIPDVSIFVDTRIPARHLYRESEYKKWINDKELYV